MKLYYACWRSKGDKPTFKKGPIRKQDALKLCKKMEEKKDFVWIEDEDGNRLFLTHNEDEW